VRVAVPTYHRPELLRSLLDAMVPHVQDLEVDPRWRVSVDVLVVDNDPDGSGAAAIPTDAGLVIGHVVEPMPGIAAARDRAMTESPDVDVLVFIDDDERPGDSWLVPLFATWFEHRPAAVAGRVVAEFETEPSPWILAGGFFTRRSLPTGTRVDAAAAGNLLLDLAQVRTLGIGFDRALGLRGGEDTLFTRSLTGAGGVILWCDESVIVDLVPSDRATTRWVLARRFSHGSTSSNVEVGMAPTPLLRIRARVGAAAAGVALVGSGLARAGYGTARRSVPDQAHGMRSAARGAGRVVGAFGLRYREYKRSG
jgi:glycosyltransferase involved in cell wall biosynthesis